MGKRIIQQRRGHGSSTYQVKGKAYRHQLKMPSNVQGEATITKIFNSPAHTSPVAKVVSGQGSFYMPAFDLMYEGQKINAETKEAKKGNIMRLKDIPVKTPIYLLESRPGDGGRFVKGAGTTASINKVVGEDIFVTMPSKKQKKFHKNCRAVIGTIAGHGRLEKPVVKAGKKHHIKKAKGKLWPRTGALKMNALDHPFGSGRGKNPKSKIAKKNAPAGARVGLVRPSRTGKKK
ncbi:MAG: 50S ribosomal protein L2 [Candidatus Pacearchaeota archaeon]